MEDQEALLDYETIRAAVAREKAALQKVLEHFSGYIEQEATIEERQPDGSVKRVVDEDLRQRLILKLLEAIPHFPLEKSGE